MNIPRRNFITLLGGTAAAWPLAARAQQPTMPVVGFLSSTSASSYAERVRAFNQGLNEAGYVDGRNVAIEYRWAEDQYDRLPALVADLVRRNAAVIVTSGSTPAALLAKNATATIPIVFGIAADPVAIGLVASLNRPGGNVTGVTNFNVEVGSKRLELLHELLPAATNIALLVNPANKALAETQSRDLQTSANMLGIKLHVVHASTEHEFDAVFANLAELKTNALVIGSDTLFVSHSEQLAVLSIHHAVAAVFQYHEFATAGGLMSYGITYTETSRQIGVYTGRILAGAKPADLPIQQPTKIELIINLKTAKALGLAIPLTLLARADEVIE